MGLKGHAEELQKMTKDEIVVDTARGWTGMTAEEYMAVAVQGRADLILALHFDVAHNASAKHQTRCHSRNMAWLKTCLQAAVAAQCTSAVFAVADGGADLTYRRLCAKDVAQQTVAGNAREACLVS
jgi:queuine/archaeosine tRNA-ribosyltransferase